MTDISITPASVVKGTGAKTRQGFSAAALLAGEVVYRDTNTFGKTDSDGAAALRVVDGICLNSAPGAGQPVTVQYEGLITIGGTVVVGTVYVSSDTPGGIMPAADLETGDYVSIIGVGVSATQIKLGILNSGVAVPAP